MRSLKTLLIVALVLSMGSMAYAELQDVEVGGSIRIRGNSYDEDSFDTNYVEQRTRINVNADFTDDVRVYIEVDDYGFFGSDFRDSPYTGDFGSAGGGAGDVSLYQGYIEVNDMWDTALRLRIGRQEISLGSEWLVGTNDASSAFTGLSFDAIRLDYGTDSFSIAGIWAKLAETGTGDFGDDDTDLYAIYGSYAGFEDITIDAYWIMIRAEGAGGGTLAGPGAGTDVDLHTIGARAGGNVGNFDFEAELAFQFGDIDFAGGGSSDTDGIGLNLELGYTFDANYEPRIYIGFAWLEGPDSGDAGFNRLFSNWEYSEFLGNTHLSNVWLIRGGVSASPTEDISLGLDLAYFQVDDEASGSDESLGFETNLHAEYQYSEDLVFRFGWAHFFADDGIEDGNSITPGVGSVAKGSSYGGGSVFAAGHGHAGLPANVGAGDDDDFDYLYFETEISF